MLPLAISKLGFSKATLCYQKIDNRNTYRQVYLRLSAFIYRRFFSRKDVYPASLGAKTRRNKK